jgi:hypothetical protein
MFCRFVDLIVTATNHRSKFAGTPSEPPAPQMSLPPPLPPDVPQVTAEMVRSLDELLASASLSEKHRQEKPSFQPTDRIPYPMQQQYTEKPYPPQQHILLRREMNGHLHSPQVCCTYFVAEKPFNL